MCALCTKEKNALILPKRRKKLAAIDSGYVCSVIGTCLTIKELKKLAGKARVQLKKDLSDYEIHSVFVNAADTARVSKALSKALDKKYLLSIKRFAKAASENDLAELWRESKASGKIAGPYWALMTHPLTTTTLAKEAYGEVHMLSHLAGAAERKLLKNNQALNCKACDLEKALADMQEQTRSRLDSKEQEITDLKKRLVEADLIVHQNAALKEKLADYENGEQMKRLEQRISDLVGQLAEKTAGLKALEYQSRHDRESLAAQQDTINQLESALQEKNSWHDSLTEELRVLQSAFCGGCEAQNTAQCPGPDLCGRKILYVGGITRLVPHYRKTVENLGGAFLHHDGGVEHTHSQLPRDVAKVDAVLCPVDCVSHDACLCVKRLCKQQNKPCIMMRSSGISSLVKGLNEINPTASKEWPQGC